MEKDLKLGSANGIDWKSEDGMDQVLLDQIGQQIEIKEKGSL